MAQESSTGLGASTTLASESREDEHERLQRAAALTCSKSRQKARELTERAAAVSNPNERERLLREALKLEVDARMPGKTMTWPRNGLSWRVIDGAKLGEVASEPVQVAKPLSDAALYPVVTGLGVVIESGLGVAHGSRNDTSQDIDSTLDQAGDAPGTVITKGVVDQNLGDSHEQSDRTDCPDQWIDLGSESASEQATKDKNIRDLSSVLTGSATKRSDTSETDDHEDLESGHGEGSHLSSHTPSSKKLLQAAALPDDSREDLTAGEQNATKALDPVMPSGKPLIKPLTPTKSKSSSARPLDLSMHEYSSPETSSPKSPRKLEIRSKESSPKTKPRKLEVRSEKVPVKKKPKKLEVRSEQSLPAKKLPPKILPAQILPPKSLTQREET